MNASSPRISPPLRAFTLLELLVVLSVIFILTLLLLPALARTRDTARTSSCLSHLKQWGIATHLYEIDSGGWLPPDGAPNGISIHNAWYANLPPMIGVPSYHD